ncbi:MAG: archaeosortase/exosortase family protein [bacterium]|jgi:cyanoexosortase A
MPTRAHLSDFFFSIKNQLPPPTLKNLWISVCGLVALQNLIIFTSTQITGNAITALIVWGGALICMEDHLETLKPKPSFAGLLTGTLIIIFVILRTARINGSDSFLYLMVPVAGFGLFLIANPFKDIINYRDSLLVLCLLPSFLVLQILVATHVSDDLSLLTAKFVLFWVGLLGIAPSTLVGTTVYVPGGAVQVMHECNGFEMIMQMFITACIFLLAFPLRSRIGKPLIFLSAPLIGFVVNSLRIALLALFTSLNSGSGKALFDFFHEQAGSLIFSGIAVFLLGYLYLAVLNRELPPLVTED